MHGGGSLALRFVMVVVAALLCAAALNAAAGLAHAQGEYSGVPEDGQGQPVEPPVDPEKGAQSKQAQAYGLRCGVGVLMGGALGCAGNLLPAVVQDNPPQLPEAPPPDVAPYDCYPLNECKSSPAEGFPLDENPRYSGTPGYEGPPASASAAPAPEDPAAPEAAVAEDPAPASASASASADAPEDASASASASPAASAAEEQYAD